MYGIPYFLIGTLINNNKETLMQIYRRKKLIVLILFFLITTLAEKYILIKINVNTIRDHYVSTTFLSIFVFLYFIKIPMVNNNNILAKIGKKYSLHIYIIHLMLVKLYNMYVINKGISNYFIQIVIFLISSLIAILYVRIKIKLFEYKRK